MPTESTTAGTIVVGVDGSGQARQALGWAARQAELTGARLLAVTAWEMPAALIGPVVFPETYNPAADAEHLARQEIEAVLGMTPPVPVDLIVAEGHPAPVLIEAAKGADLLVVGNRGYGGFTGMLIGSVSEHLASHSPCPLVIIR
jgi:nucleotide-binding universal stress UspA family protein